jgi:hypothetical protein
MFTSISFFPYIFIGTRGSVVGWDTMLQPGRSPIRVPDELDFFNLPNPSSRTMALGSTQPLTKMSTRNLPGGKMRPARRADNLAAICEPNVWKYGSLNLSEPWGPPRTVTGIALPLPYIFILKYDLLTVRSTTHLKHINKNCWQNFYKNTYNKIVNFLEDRRSTWEF